MARRLKLLTGLSTIAAAGAFALGGCGASNDAETVAAAPVDHGAHQPSGGESAGAESEGAGAVDAATDNVAYISQLLQMRGHLQAGVALYRAGETAQAITHMKHPKDELYANLVPAFTARGYAGFASELEDLSAAVQSGASAADVDARLEAARAGIDGAISAAGASSRDEMLAFSAVVRTAGEEFDIGVKDGAIVNIHEYQDAYGFMTTVSDRLAAMTAPELQDAVDKLRAQTDIALAVAPTATPNGPVTTSSSAIYGAAARMELVARGIE